MFREARKDFTLQNIDYLRPKDHGGPGAYLGALTNGKNCQRMSCQYASGIYVCNDNDYAINVLFTTLADYAQAVVDDPRKECNWHEDHYEGGKDGEDLTWGQAFDANGWLVLGPLVVVDTCAWGCAPPCVRRCCCCVTLTLGLTLGTSLLACGILMTTAHDPSIISRECERENVWWWRRRLAAAVAFQ